MPATWTDITRPTISSEPPWSRRCSGVIVITATMTPLAVTMATSPDLAARWRSRRRSSPEGGPSRRGCSRGLETSGDDERIRSQEQPDDSGRHREPHERHQERTRQGRQSEPIGEPASGTEHVRTRDGTDRGRPHDRGDAPRSVFRRGQVGTRIASEQVRGGARSEQDHPGEQQRERLDLGGDHGGPGSGHRREVATDEPGPSPAP